jgi:hypothetical protein
MLLMSVTAQVLFLVSSQGKHFWTHELVFLNMFYNEDDYTDNSINRIQNFFNLDEMVSHIDNTIE